MIDTEDKTVPAAEIVITRSNAGCTHEPTIARARIVLLSFGQVLTRQAWDFGSPKMIHLAIEPDHWFGIDIESRVANAFANVGPASKFKVFIARQAETDPTANLGGWRRGLSRDGLPELCAVVTWRAKTSLWRFPLISTFWDPLDSRRYWIFDADVPRIGLDLGIFMADAIFMALPTPIGL